MSSEMIVLGKPAGHIVPLRFLFWLNICFIALVILLGGFFIAFYTIKTQQITQSTSQFAAQIKEADTKNSIIQAQLIDLQAALNNQSVKLAQQAQTLQQLTAFTQQKEWYIDEIRYLIHLADTKSTFDHNISESIHLLNKAHRMILDEHDPLLNHLDKAVQSDIQALVSVNDLDISSIFVQLAKLERNIDDMPLLGSAFVNGEDISIEETIPVVQTWRDRLKNTWQELKEFIVVRKTPNSLMPLIAQEQGEYINQYIHMQLAQAEWALLRHNNAIYQSSLEQVNLWINRYYVALNPRTQDVLSVLTDLQARRINLPKLTLNKTLDALSEFNKSYKE